LAASTRLVSGRVEYVRLFGVGWSERETTCACQKLDNLFLHALETPACNSTGPEPMFSLKCKEFLGMPHAFFKEDTRSAEPLYLRLELGGPRQKSRKTNKISKLDNTQAFGIKKAFFNDLRKKLWIAGILLHTCANTARYGKKYAGFLEKFTCQVPSNCALTNGSQPQYRPTVSQFPLPKWPLCIACANTFLMLFPLEYISRAAHPSFAPTQSKIHLRNSTHSFA